MNNGHWSILSIGNRPLAVGVAMVIVAAVASGFIERQDGPRTRPKFSSSSGLFSSSVAGSWISRTDEKSQATLVLLALWRGQPGWFVKARAGFSGRTGGSSGGGSGGGGQTVNDVLTSQVQYGDLRLGFSFAPATRRLTIQGKEIVIPEKANVLLLDEVDRSGEPKLVEVLSIEPALSAAGSIGEAMRRSPKIVAFLRCEVKLEATEATLQKTLDTICAQLIGK